MIKPFCAIAGIMMSGAAFGGQLATVEYIHRTILAKTGIDVPYNPQLTNKNAPANTTYLLTAIDAMNAMGPSSTKTNYRNSKYATTQAVDTTAADWAANNLLNCNGAGWYVNNGHCVPCPRFAYCPAGISNFVSCEDVCEGCATEAEGASQASDCLASSKTFDFDRPIYFDTGIDNQGDWKIETKYRMSDYLPNQNHWTSALFCARDQERSVSKYGFCYFLLAANDSGRADCGTNMSVLPKWDNNVHTIVMGRDDGVILDGNVYKSGNCTITQGRPINFIIGAITSDGMVHNLNYAPFYGKIYYFKMWKDKLLVRHFVPIFAGESINGVTATENAMFDMVTNTVYYNLAKQMDSKIN